MPVEGVQRVRVKAVLSCGPPHSHRQECLQSQTGGRGVSWPVANNFSDPLRFLSGLSGVSDGKESACNTGDLSLTPGLGRSPEGGNGYPLQYSCLENSMDRGSLASYSPWGHKESDRTE